TEYLRKIESLGGMLVAIEAGWVQSEIQDAAYGYQLSIEQKERIVVGVNEFELDEDAEISLHAADPALEAAQIKSLSEMRANRDDRRVRTVLEQLETAVQGSENLMPHIIEAVEAYATIGEISDAFRKVHGEYKEAMAF